MTIEEQVRAAVEQGSPGVALVILARAVDALRTPEPKLDWTIPEEPNSPAEKLDPPTDPDDRLAWEAQQRLDSDAQRSTPDIGVDCPATRAVELADGTEIQVPVAPPEVKKRRLRFADEHFEGDAWWSRPELAIPTDVAIDAYVAGGPVWLHAYDREFVLGLPRHARVAMVQDLETHAPDDAHLLARDILKDTDPGATRAIQLEARGVPGDV